MIIQRSEVFSTNGILAASSCGAAALPQPQFDYGFLAQGLQIVNTCGGRLFYNLAGRVATTADAFIACGQTMIMDGASFLSCGLSLSTTSTSTAAGGGPVYSISAYSSA
jgi:hypothetical protein